MLAESARAAAPVHVEHANEEVARLLRLDHVMCGENPRHVPDLEILLYMRKCFGEAFVASGKIVHYIGGEDRIHEAYFGGRPCHHRVVVDAAPHGDIGAAIGLAGDQRDLRHGGEAGRVHEIHDLPRRATPLGIETDDKTRRIHDAHQRDVEAVAQHREVHALAAGIGGERTATDGGIVGNDADRAAGEPRQSDDRWPAEPRLDFKKAVDVEDDIDNLFHVVNLGAFFRQNVEDALLRRAGAFRDRRHRRQFAVVARHIG